MDVELRDLRYALIVSQHRSLHQAAGVLQLRQSTLSRRLRALECRVGAKLFDRNNGGTRPTIAGQEFLEIARRILTETDAAFVRLRRRCSGENGRLTIGSYAPCAAGNLRATLSEQLRRFPEVEVTTVDGVRSRLLSDVAAGSVDVAIVTDACADWSDRRLPLWSERVVVAMPEHHRLRDETKVRWSDLQGENFLFSQGDPGPELQRLLLIKLGCPDRCRISEHEGGTERIISLVGAGFGIALVSEGATGAAYNGVVYRELQDDEGYTRLDFLACWSQRNPNPTLGPFLDMLRERYLDL